MTTSTLSFEQFCNLIRTAVGVNYTCYKQGVLFIAIPKEEPRPIPYSGCVRVYHTSNGWQYFYGGYCGNGGSLEDAREAALKEYKDF